MIVIDAMPHRHVSPSLTPHLWHQAATGGRAPMGALSLPVSVTYANHAAFVTGADPAVTGVHGNHTWIDDHGWAPSPKQGPRAVTLFDRVGDARGSSAMIAGDQKLIAQMGGGRADVSWPPNGRLPEGTARCAFGYASDAAVLSALEGIDLDVDFAVIHLNEPDTTSHLHGPDSAEAVEQYRATDAAYGEVVGRLADGWDHTLVLTVSDHDQEAITDFAPVELAETFAAIEGVEVADEGTAALLHRGSSSDHLDDDRVAGDDRIGRWRRSGLCAHARGVDGVDRTGSGVRRNPDPDPRPARQPTLSHPDGDRVGGRSPRRVHRPPRRANAAVRARLGTHDRRPPPDRRSTFVTGHPQRIDAIDVDVDAFRRDGWLIVRGALPAAQVDAVDTAVARLERWAVDGGPGLHHFEQTDAGAVLARSEDFVHDEPVLRDLIEGGVIGEILGALFDEPAVLFKEKVNFKQPGGGGFAPHQDATAYRFVDHHISCMVPLDPSTPASGCLYVAPGFETGRLPTDERGRIDEATASGLDWRPAPVEPGDLLFFDSYTPHYSDTNTTTRARRAAYLTYNAASLGDHRDRYYADKRAEFAEAGDDFDGQRVRISITDDFLGKPVSGAGAVGE